MYWINRKMWNVAYFAFVFSYFVYFHISNCLFCNIKSCNKYVMCSLFYSEHCTNCDIMNDTFSTCMFVFFPSNQIYQSDVTAYVLKLDGKETDYYCRPLRLTSQHIQTPVNHFSNWQPQCGASFFLQYDTNPLNKHGWSSTSNYSSREMKCQSDASYEETKPPCL